MMLGLLVSTLANSEEVAIATLPLLVLPQLLFTGVVSGLDSARDGTFRSLVFLFQKAPGATHTFIGWVLELLSITMYSRPAVCLLQAQQAEERVNAWGVAKLVDGVHLVLLLLVTAAALIAVIQHRERRWVGMI